MSIVGLPECLGLACFQLGEVWRRSGSWGCCLGLRAGGGSGGAAEVVLVGYAVLISLCVGDVGVGIVEVPWVRHPIGSCENGC